MKSTKKSLITSGLALLVSFALLAGTTFAWFTDSVTNQGNKIQAGNLAVDLLMDKEQNGTYVSIAEEDGAIFDADENGNGYNWEPGMTQIVYLGVQNKGTLALNYNFILDVTDAGLVGSLEYAALNGTRAADMQGITTWEEVVDKATSDMPTTGGVGDVVAGNTTFAPGRVLEPEETAYFAMAVHMKEDADNDYQNGSITIDVNLIAKQAMSETDGFGSNQYDKDAEYDTTSAEVQEAIKNLQAGDTLSLAAGSFDLGGVTIPDDVTIIGSGADETVLTGAVKFTGEAAIKEVTLQATAANNLQAVATDGNASVDGKVITIENSVISGYKYGVQLASKVSNTKLVLNNVTFDNVWCAISVKTGNSPNGDPSTGNTYEANGCTYKDVVYQLQTFYPNIFYKTIGDESSKVDGAVAEANKGNWIQAVTPDVDLKDAIDSVMDGGTVVVPAGEYELPLLTDLGDKEVVIKGEAGAKFVRTDEGFITVRGSSDAKLTIRDMTFVGTAKNDGSRGICFSGQGNENATLVVENCDFDTLNTGIFLGGVANATITDCTFTNCGAGIGGTETLTGTLKIDNCQFENNDETIGWAGAGNLVITGSPSCGSFNLYQNNTTTSVEVTGGEYNSQS